MVWRAGVGGLGWVWWGREGEDGAVALVWAKSLVAIVGGVCSSEIMLGGIALRRINSYRCLKTFENI